MKQSTRGFLSVTAQELTVNTGVHVVITAQELTVNTGGACCEPNIGRIIFTWWVEHYFRYFPLVSLEHGRALRRERVVQTSGSVGRCSAKHGACQWVKKIIGVILR